MAFKSETVRRRFGGSHPDVQAVYYDLREFCMVRGYPEPVATCVERTAEENKAVGGVPTSLHVCKNGEACRAIDFRNTHYTPAQKLEIEAYLAKRCPSPTWERVFKVHGNGPHWHLGLEREKRNG